MLQCMDGPTPILRFLCQNYHIHSLPIGQSGTDYTKVPPAISVFYLGKCVCVFGWWLCMCVCVFLGGWLCVCVEIYIWLGMFGVCVCVFIYL